MQAVWTGWRSQGQESLRRRHSFPVRRCRSQPRCRVSTAFARHRNHTFSKASQHSGTGLLHEAVFSRAQGHIPGTPPTSLRTTRRCFGALFLEAAGGQADLLVLLRLLEGVLAGQWAQRVMVKTCSRWGSALVPLGACDARLLRLWQERAGRWSAPRTRLPHSAP